jgi:hypothetical protein
MLTENGKKWVKYIGNTGLGASTYKKTDGNNSDFYQFTPDNIRSYMGNTNYNTPPTSETYAGGSEWGKWIGIGTGDTTESASDYCLDNFVSLTFVSASASNVMGLTNLTMTYQNDTQASVTIKEVGLYLTMSGWQFLFARKVLSTPITIPVGQSRAFTVHIDINS